MIGNEVCITSKKDLELIYGISKSEPTISIGQSILEGQVVPLSINKIFASHIGVFGNTGSGKSNTLHKLFLELFRSEYREKILEYSKFYVIDFNGEYTKDDSFGVTNAHKKVFNVKTRSNISKKSRLLRNTFLTQISFQFYLELPQQLKFHFLGKQ